MKHFDLTEKIYLISKMASINIIKHNIIRINLVIRSILTIFRELTTLTNNIMFMQGLYNKITV